MATLSGNKVKDTYQSLLKLNSNGATTTIKAIEDGAGVETALSLSTDMVQVDALSFSTAPNTDGAELTALLIDGSNNVVKRELDSSAFSAVATNTFKTISVSGQSDVVADSSTDTLTLTGGTGIDITTDAANDNITIANSASAFKTISVAGQQNVVADALDDTLNIVEGNGIIITTDNTTDTITISSEFTNSNAFKTISVAGQQDVVADALDDTLNIAEGEGITITTNDTTDTITISASEFGNPMILARPSADFSLSTTPTTPSLAPINNSDDFESYEINNNQSHLEIVSNGIKVLKSGLIRIDISFIIDVTTSNTKVTINIGRERPEGSTYTPLQEISRDKSTTGVSAIGYSLFTPAIANDVYTYKISVSSGSGDMLTASSFNVIKLS